MDAVMQLVLVDEQMNAHYERIGNNTIMHQYVPELGKTVIDGLFETEQDFIDHFTGNKEVYYSNLDSVVSNLLYGDFCYFMEQH